MPKMKTHRGAAKRFKKTGTGKFVRANAFKQHILTSKTRSRKRKLRGNVVVAVVSERWPLLSLHLGEVLGEGDGGAVSQCRTHDLHPDREAVAGLAEGGRVELGRERVDELLVVALDHGPLDLHRRGQLARLDREVVVEELELHLRYRRPRLGLPLRLARLRRRRTDQRCDGDHVVGRRPARPEQRGRAQDNDTELHVSQNLDAWDGAAGLAKIKRRGGVAVNRIDMSSLEILSLAFR